MDEERKVCSSFKYLIIIHSIAVNKLELVQKHIVVAIPFQLLHKANMYMYTVYKITPSYVLPTGRAQTNSNTMSVL